MTAEQANRRRRRRRRADDYWDSGTQEPIFTGGTPGVTHYTFDLVGNLDKVTLPSGATSDYDYDATNRLDTLVTRDAQGDKLFEQDYAYIADGQRDFVVEKRYDGVSSQPFSTVKIDWTYDALNRLVAETRDADPTPANGVDNFGTQEAGDYAETFAFDLAGNRTRRVLDHFDAAKDETITYAHNERDQLMSEDSTIAANDKSYLYDGNGSTTQVTKNGVSTYYLWDLRNRMAGISLDNDGNSTDAGETSYTYDHNGVRVRQATVGGDTTVYVNDTQNPTSYTKGIEERDAAGAVQRSFVIGLGVEAVAQGPAGAVEVAYQVHDGHGSTRLLLASDGDVLEAYDYTAFGDPLLIDDTGADLTDTRVRPVSDTGSACISGHLGVSWCH